MAVSKNHQSNFVSKKEKDLELTSSKLLSNSIRILLWTFFMLNIFSLIYFYPAIPEWTIGNLFKINGFTILIWATVTFFSALISSFSANYLMGFKYKSKFMWLCLGFTLSVILFVMANHVLILIATWLLMGTFMSQLIGIDKDWGEAREALKFTLRYFLYVG